MSETSRQARLGYAIAAVLAGLVLLTCLLVKDARWQRLAAHGTIVQGRVVGRRSTTGKGASNVLTVEFPGAFGSRTEEYTVPDEIYQGHVEGDTIPVVADPKDATNSELVEFSSAEANRRLFLWSLGWLGSGLLVGFLFWADKKGVDLQVKQLREWRLGSMEVDRVRAADAKQGGLFLSGHYLDEAGRRHTLTGIHLPRGFQIHERIPILYDEFSEGAIALAAIDKADLDAK